MKMLFTILYASVISGLMLLSQDLLASPQKTDSSAAATEVSASVLLYNKDDQSCSLIADKAGHSAFMFACDYSPDKVIVQKMPSQATVLLTEGDCTESTEKSKWWVKIQATARETSSVALPMQSILAIATSWAAKPPEDTFVAPYLKIIGAQVQDPGEPRIDCSLLQLPVVEPQDMLYTVPQVRQPTSENAQCGAGVLIGIYWISDIKMEHQCATLLGADRQPFSTYDSSTITMRVSDTPQYCPGGKVVTGIQMTEEFGIANATLTCSRLKNTAAGLKLNVASEHERNRWVSTNKHNSICERPSAQGSAYLLSSPNRFMTGLDLATNEAMWFCSEVTPAPL